MNTWEVDDSHSRTVQKRRSWAVEQSRSWRVEQTSSWEADTLTGVGFETVQQLTIKILKYAQIENKSTVERVRSWAAEENSISWNSLMLQQSRIWRVEQSRSWAADRLNNDTLKHIAAELSNVEQSKCSKSRTAEKMNSWNTNEKSQSWNVKHSRSETVARLNDWPVEELNSWAIDELKQLNRRAVEGLPYWSFIKLYYNICVFYFLQAIPFGIASKYTYVTRDTHCNFIKTLIFYKGSGLELLWNTCV